MDINHSNVLLIRLIKLMGRLTRRKERLVNQPFEQLSGFNMKSFYALYLLAQGDCQPGQLVKDLGIPNSTATRILDHLEAEGLIAREPNRADLRQMVLSLTPAGRTRYQTAWAQYLTCLHQGFGNLPEDVLQRAISALLELEQTLEQHERRPQEAEV